MGDPVGAVLAATTVTQLATLASDRSGPALSPFPPFQSVGFFGLRELPVTFLPGGLIRLTRDVLFVDPVEGTKVIPDSFVSDGTSSPSWTWVLVGHPYSYSLLPASLLHDSELEQALIARRDGRAHPSRVSIDRLYYRALRLWGRGVVRASLIYAGVRLKAIVTGRNFAACEVAR